MWMAKAPVIFVITVEYKRITGKYGERGIRYALIEVGHAGQNLFLEAEALGLGAGIVGAFNDAEVSEVAGLPPEHEPLLIMPVGYKN
jgi:SagB-type dehydrogenase family enzyme